MELKKAKSCGILNKKVAPAKYLKLNDRRCEPKFMEDHYDREAAYKWFKVKKTQVEMMKDRGLEIPEEEKMLFLNHDPTTQTLRNWEKETIPEFVALYSQKAREENLNFNSTLTNVYFDPLNGINTVVIYLCRERDSMSITADEFKNKFYYYRDKYYISNKQLKMVFISEVPLNKKEEAAERLNFISCQFFSTEQLSYNPTKHMFYEPHELLTEEERNKILKERGVRPDQLPILKYIDPIRRYFDWPSGGIVRIRRKEKYLEIPAKKGPYYRVIKK